MTEWTHEDGDFLRKDNPSSDLLVVIDNTNYLSSFSNSIRADEQREVVYSLKIQTHFISNNFYKTAMMFFVVLFGILVATILLNLCLHRQQRKAYNHVTEAKREIRRLQLQKEQDDLRDDLSQLKESNSTI